MEKLWYQKNWFVVVSLILFFPVGLFLMYKYTKWNKWIKKLITIIIILIGIPILFEDTESPKIELIQQDYVLYKNDTISEAELLDKMVKSVSDNKDNVTINDISIKNFDKINFSKKGKYKVTLILQDKSENTEEKNVQIIVKNNEKEAEEKVKPEKKAEEKANAEKEAEEKAKAEKEAEEKAKAEKEAEEKAKAEKEAEEKAKAEKEAEEKAKAEKEAEEKAKTEKEAEEKAKAEKEAEEKAKAEKEAEEKAKAEKEAEEKAKAEKEAFNLDNYLVWDTNGNDYLIPKDKWSYYAVKSTLKEITKEDGRQVDENQLQFYLDDVLIRLYKPNEDNEIELHIEENQNMEKIIEVLNSWHV